MSDQNRQIKGIKMIVFLHVIKLKVGQTLIWVEFLLELVQQFSIDLDLLMGLVIYLYS